MNGYCYDHYTVAHSFHHLLAQMHEDANATHQLNYQRRSGPFRAKHAANAAVTFLISDNTVET